MKTRGAGVLGLGKAGGSLAASLLNHGVPLVGTRSRDERRRRAFSVRHPHAPKAHARLSSFLGALEEGRAWILFLAAPDDALADVAAKLKGARWLPPVVAHLSGSRGAEALATLEGETTPAAFHPLAALDGERPIPDGTLLAVDATKPAVVKQLAELARTLALSPARVRRGQHARYHLGAVVTANLAVALLDEGVQHLVAAGIDGELARVSLARLLASTARAAEQKPLPEMMTGPIARGDASTVERHLRALADAHDEGSERLYRQLSLRLLEVAHLDERVKKRLGALLEG